MSKEPARSPPRLVTVDSHLEYITNKAAHDLCKVVLKIKTMDELGIELKPTQYYLALQYRGRNLAVVYPKRDFFYLSYPEKGETIYVEVRKSTDVTEEAFSKIKQVYMKLSGRTVATES